MVSLKPFGTGHAKRVFAAMTRAALWLLSIPRSPNKSYVTLISSRRWVGARGQVRTLACDAIAGLSIRVHAKNFYREQRSRQRVIPCLLRMAKGKYLCQQKRTLGSSHCRCSPTTRALA